MGESVKPTKTWHEMESLWLRDPVFLKETKKAETEFCGLDLVLSLRRETGFTQEEIAKHMGVAKTTVERLEARLVSGKLPSLKTLERYARAFGKRLEI